MNKNQKMVLVIGAIVLLIALLSTPSYIDYRGNKYDPASETGKNLINSGSAKTLDIGNALVRGIAVAGATLLVCYALKDRKA